MVELLVVVLRSIIFIFFIFDESYEIKFVVNTHLKGYSRIFDIGPHF